MHGRGRGDDGQGLRDLRKGGAGAEPRAGTDRGDGQPGGTPTEEGEGALTEENGCELLYLPSYSPDYNPIEEAFAKMKNLSFARRRPGPRRPLSKR